MSSTAFQKAPKARRLIATGGASKGGATRGYMVQMILETRRGEGTNCACAPSGLGLFWEFFSTGSRPSGASTRGYQHGGPSGAHPIPRIRAGVSNLRNPILASFVAKGLLPYKGLGSGIKRILEASPETLFVEDRDGCQFTMSVKREPMTEEMTVKSAVNKKTPVETPVESVVKEKTPVKIISLLTKDPTLSSADLAKHLKKSKRAIERAIQKLQENKQLRHSGPTKGGHWEVL